MKKWPGKHRVADVVLDASAVLAVLNDETGASQVWAVLPGAIISAVNAAEVATKLVDAGTEADKTTEFIQRLGLRVAPFQEVDVEATARLRQRSKKAGLSLGDRACLALAERIGAPAITADRQWLKIELGIDINLIR